MNIKLLISMKDYVGDYTNDLTREMDEYRLESYKKGYGKTHIMAPRDVNICVISESKYDESKGRIMRSAIRYPGATRGGIALDDNNIIQSIDLIDQTCFGIVACYDKKLKTSGIFDKYIGMKIVFEDIKD